jgi:hypothetical protein
MSLVERIGRRGRFDNLREIRTLDPYDDADRDRIVTLTGRYDLPWDFDQGTAIAFLRDYGVPSIARLLDRTKQFEDDGLKRYDDTLYFQEEAILEGVDSARSHRAVDRLNRIHGTTTSPTTSSSTSWRRPWSARCAGSRSTAGGGWTRSSWSR